MIFMGFTLKHGLIMVNDGLIIVNRCSYSIYIIFKNTEFHIYKISSILSRILMIHSSPGGISAPSESAFFLGVAMAYPEMPRMPLPRIDLSSPQEARPVTKNPHGKPRNKGGRLK